MIVYIIKLSACLGIFLAFYKLFLEGENMHQFKRFYLVGIVLTSIVIPFITFTDYIESLPVSESYGSISALPIGNASTAIESSTNFLPILLWSIYGLGVILFGLKFGYNLFKIIFKIKKNPKQKTSNFINVLLTDLVTPHTFFSYIFLNKHKYETYQIPKEVLLHEQTHAKQKHSIDILLIEIIQVIFWFNPLIYFTKNSMKLNHEFLSDKAVLSKGIEAKNYQQILLAFSTNQKESQLANAINYSSIKKRLTVMKTHTSKSKIWLRSIVLLPLLALTLYSFSDRKEVVKEFSSESTDSPNTARSIDINVFDNGTYEVDGITATKKSFVSVINQLHKDITPEIRNQIINIHVNNGKAVSDEEVWFIYNSVLDYGFHRIVAYNQEIIRAKGNKPFAITSTDTQKRTKVISENQDGASRELMKEYDKLAKHYNMQSQENMRVKKTDVERMKYIYGLMSAKQKKSAEPFPNIPPPPAPKAPKAPKANKQEQALPPPPPPPIPKTATPEQKIKYQKVINEYNKKYTVKNGMVSENPPPPPPPIPKNATDAEKKKYNKAIKQYKQKTEKRNKVKANDTKQLKEQKLAYAEARAAKLKIEKGELVRVRELQSKERVLKLKTEQLAYKEARVAKLKTEKDELAQVRELQSKERVSKLKDEKLAYKEAQIAKLSTEKRLASIKEIQPPKSPLDFVIDMAKKDAKFFYKEKEISSDEAIKLLKKSPEMNINNKKSKSGTPLVYISKKPMVIGTKGKSE